MTAKEKAAEILNGHILSHDGYNTIGPIARSIVHGRCKRHALITVDAIIHAINHSFYPDLAHDYWDEVKQELEKL